MSEGVASVVLREMTLADVPAVLAGQEFAAVVGLAEVFPQDRYPFPREALEQRWRQEIAAPDIDCYAVLLTGSIVGFAATQGDELLHFGIDVEQWGTGIAQTAHDEVLDAMRARGVEQAWLRVFVKNARGRRFYEKLGWRSTGTATHSSFPPFAELVRYEITLGDPRPGS